MPDTQTQSSTEGPPGTSPSQLYRMRLWRLGLKLVRVLPDPMAKAIATIGGAIHYHLQPQRRELVVRNLLPVLGGDRPAAERTARRLYRNFARKLVDLWRVESGVPVHDWIAAPGELEIIRAAMKRGRGVLFVTLHLGNWEHGGLLLGQMGIPLTVLTLAEPEVDLTELRAESRARWGIGSLIIGQDIFALVEAIQQLQAGAALGLAVDRPPGRNSAPVDFFGHAFEATLAAAELARASGCALIGVTVVRQPQGYAVKVLKEFPYDRQALGTRESRRELTQQILRAFEPEIRQNLDQWYQFVPIWPKGD